MANTIALIVARNVKAGIDVREHGVAAIEKPLRFYASDQIHNCHRKAIEAMGLGNRALQRIPTDDDLRIDLDALRAAIARDRDAGFQPACVIGNAGTVNTGAIDDLQALADLAVQENLWFHIDGCIGALLAIAPDNAHRVRGLERADSVALDPHKWLHAPFEVGCVLVRDAAAHRASFAVAQEYLEKAPRGLASGEWLYEYGLQTSRGFRALKVWMALKEHGVEKFGRLIDQNIAQARYLDGLIDSEPLLESVAPNDHQHRLLPLSSAGPRRARLEGVSTSKSCCGCRRTASLPFRTRPSTASIVCGSRSTTIARGAPISTSWCGRSSALGGRLRSRCGWMLARRHSRKTAVDASVAPPGRADTHIATLRAHRRRRYERILGGRPACVSSMAMGEIASSAPRSRGRETYGSSRGLTMDVGEWLRSIGLGQYEAAFRDNEIDDDVLWKLTADDLKDLGVTIVGHRRKIMTAIAEPSGSAAAPAAAAETKRLPQIVETTQATAERRQLTVLFCDLAGSTAMSARLDPEDMRDVIRAYQDICSGVIARYDGYLAKFMGDGVLAYFGFPHAHEDDAERAVRAGLDLGDAIAKVQTRDGEVLKTRIGIATGIVVVGDLVGEGAAREQAVIGDTPNLAARLQARAEPSAVLIADQTRRLLGNAFELKSVDLRNLKGLDAPVRAWTVLREAEAETRFEASRSSRMTPFVGREPEVALLVERWQDACSGEGKVALLSGEAGIGKSRVVATLGERIADEPHLAIRYQCSPHHVNDAFYPIVSHIWRAAEFASDESSGARLEKLETMARRSRLEPKEIVPFMASLCSVPLEGRYAELEMAPAEQKERLIAALLAFLEGLTKEAPVLALLEDAHWIDPSSLEVFTRFVDRLPSLRAFLIITFRPDFVAPWIGQAHVHSVVLSRFGRRHALAMIDRVTGGKALPAEVLEQIVAKTDGVPLFVEELTKTVLESGLLREDDGSYVLTSALTPLAIPSNFAGFSDGAARSFGAD